MFFLSIVALALFIAALCTVAAMIVGLLLSQYCPVFGGFIEKSVAEPWSSIRISLIPIHIFVFGLIAFIFGAGLGALIGIVVFLLRTESESSKAKLGFRSSL